MKYGNDERKLDEIRELAQRAAGSAYAPYSGFRVAAVLEGADGRLWSGANVESAVPSLGICAERNALFQAVASGAREFSRMLVYSPDGPAYPCGSCRQALLEFCGSETQILVMSPDGSVTGHTLGDLLPCAFTLPHPEGWEDLS
ncbi:cytidine deaminase [Candidatus Fermentibacterales bacterium]|nr:cytidine deaminase [Candidatus Fermentibacterales bacterium]